MVVAVVAERSSSFRIDEVNVTAGVAGHRLELLVAGFLWVVGNPALDAQAGCRAAEEERGHPRAGR